MSLRPLQQTTLRVFREQQPEAPPREVTDDAEIARELAAIGARFERFSNHEPLPSDGD